MANKLQKMMPKSTANQAYAVDCPRPSKNEEAERRRYRAEDALRTITRAEELKRDRKLMSDVKCVAREQMKTLSNVTGSKKR